MACVHATRTRHLQVTERALHEGQTASSTNSLQATSTTHHRCWTLPCVRWTSSVLKSGRLRLSRDSSGCCIWRHTTGPSASHGARGTASAMVVTTNDWLSIASTKQHTTDSSHHRSPSRHQRLCIAHPSLQHAPVSFAVSCQALPHVRSVVKRHHHDQPDTGTASPARAT
jgi:hypothetical protein